MKVTKVLAAIVSGIMFVTTTGIPNKVSSVEKEGADETKILFDDFNGNTLDTSKWLVAYKNWGGTDSSTGLPYNGGVLPENVSIKNGNLILTGHGNNYEGDLMGINRDLSKRADGKRVGGAIATRDYYGSGSYEVRAKISPELGACSAIWTFEYEEYYPGDAEYERLAKGGSYYAVNHEIDIEMPGRPASSHKNQSFEYALCNTWVGEKSSEYTTNYTNIGVAQNDGEYHTYRFDWHTGDVNETKRVDFYFDGVLVTTNYTNVPTNKGRLWIGLWFPKSWAGVPNFDTTSFDVDYVKITPFNESGDTEQHESYPNDGWATGTLIEKEKEGNLIKNSNFENGVADWNLSGDAKVINNQAVLSSGSKTDTISQKVSVLGNETYRLTAKVHSSGTNIEVGVSDYNGRYTNINKVVNSDGTVTIDFTVASHMKEISVYAKVLRYQDSKTPCYVEDISLKPLLEAIEEKPDVPEVTTPMVTTTPKVTTAPVTTTAVETTVTTTAPVTTTEVTTVPAISANNLVENGDFSNGSTSWRLTGSAKIENNTCILASGSNTDEVYQKVSVEPGKTYKLTCDVTTTGSNIEIGINGATSKYSTKNVFTSQSKAIEIEFTVAKGIKSIDIYGRVLRYQDNKDDCYVDNFVLCEK